MGGLASGGILDDTLQKVCQKGYRHRAGVVLLLRMLDENIWRKVSCSHG